MNKTLAIVLVIGSWFLLMGALGAFDYSARSARDRASHAERLACLQRNSAAECAALFKDGAK